MPLLLHRLAGQSVVIGHDTMVTVHKVKGERRVILEITAPPEVPIYRDEILPPDHPMSGRVPARPEARR